MRVMPKAVTIAGPERLLKRLVRSQLPPEAFRPKPSKALLVFPMLALIALLSASIRMTSHSWIFDAVASLVLGCLYGSLFLFGHEIAHGKILRSTQFQDLLLYPCFAIYCLSPQLWRVWHNHVHHAHTNVEGIDPDNFGTSSSWTGSLPDRIIWCFSPGSGNLLSLSYLFLFLTVQSQRILWCKSHSVEFKHLRRVKAIAETSLMLAFWAVISALVGWHATLYIIIVPMFVANAIPMSYIVTNHQLRGLTTEVDTLATTMSVSTCRWLDFVHLNFSHHVEHHLFPTLDMRFAPRVRAILVQYAEERYICPEHWRALVMIFRTPRVYANAFTLTEPVEGREVSIRAIERILSRSTRSQVPKVG